MILTSKLKDDILALLEFAGKIYAGKNDGEILSDSKASKMCFKHGEFVMNLRKWQGGTGSPTLQKTGEFETFLRDLVGEKEYEKFLRTRGRPTVEAKPVNDFDD